jgi:hypothetical protein
LVNVASAANCVLAERYMRYTCDRGMCRYGITVIADVGLFCKLILAGVLTEFAKECFMRHNSNTVALHSAITGIEESYKVE